MLLDLLAEGLTNRQIADRMFLAENTVKNSVEDELCIDVVDNGRGIASPVTESGLANLRHSAEEAGGEFSVGNAAGGGARAALVGATALSVELH